MIIGISRPGPGPKKKSKLSKVSAKQKAENEKRASIRESGRGKPAKPSRIVTDKRGKAVRDKKGKAIKRLTKEQLKKLREGR